MQRSTRNFQRGDRKGAGWAEYGDRHGVTATRITGLFMALLWRRYLQRQVFSGGLRREFLQATEPQEIFSSPAAQSFLINGGKHRVFRCQATLVPATPGWGTASFG